jgi:hypothetical protein
MTKLVSVMVERLATLRTSSDSPYRLLSLELVSKLWSKEILRSYFCTAMVVAVFYYYYYYYYY